MRQCPDHYTIRAGRNLPDKEFRYLRTVIVTAAVYLVKKGETIFSIARKRGTTVDAIMKLNHLKRSSRLMPGQILKYN